MGRLDPLAPYLPPMLLQFLRGQARRLRGRMLVSQAQAPATFQPEDIESIRQLFCTVGNAEGTAWDPLRHAHMPLPAWFVKGLDPWSQAYRDQQVRLWQLITGVERGYDPDADEVEAFPPDIDAVRSPAYYTRRDAQAIESASDHVLATGMLLKHSKLVSGDRAIEYGAGFGQTALTLARLGVQVDTVDISRNFCNWIQQQADFFQVPLRPHHGHFGFNPHPEQRYKLIWFYESFHHCWNFEQVVPQLAAMLQDGGRVILGGEPIFEQAYAAVPYPWGVRLHSEVAAVMRHTRWMELGFTESFLYELFARSGLKGMRVDCAPSRFGQLYIFERQVLPS
jgi:SAM-dependent methyltransferase